VFERDELAKVKVEAVVTGHERGKKIHVLKFKPKRGYKRRSGHRSDLTRLEIKDIKMLSRRPAAKTAAKKTEEAEDGS
jgi:large subunit ribosomal protein L21